MAGHSKKLWLILLFCASIVRTDETVASKQSTESAPGKQDDINTNAVALCKSRMCSLVKAYLLQIFLFINVHFQN